MAHVHLDPPTIEGCVLPGVEAEPSKARVRCLSLDLRQKRGLHQRKQIWLSG